MKRINIAYAGRHYSIGNTDFDELKQEIIDANVAGDYRWLIVNEGEGRPQKAEILIGPGIPIGLAPVPGDTDEAS